MQKRTEGPVAGKKRGRGRQVGKSRITAGGGGRIVELDLTPSAIRNKKPLEDFK